MLRTALVVGGLLVLGTWSVAAAVEQEVELPPGVTSEMVSEGKALYEGAGICFACHASSGAGMPGVGPSLIDQDWIQMDGTFAEIEEIIAAGVPFEKSKSGVVMPPKGGTPLTDAQIRSIAAYVWVISRP